MNPVRLAILGGLAASALLVPGAARADDIILCTGSIDGGGETCVYESDVPVLNKHPECWPLTTPGAIQACLGKPQ
jgi:hypothetical protein